MSAADAGAGADRLPPVPSYAWSWLQRSRPVLAEVARRLTGEPPSAGFVDELRTRASADPFTRDVLLDVIAEVAFGGRVPSSRPPGASWDRGLLWWAATLAGTTPAAFEAAKGDPPEQRVLFPAPSDEPGQGAAARSRAASGAALRERRALAAALRALLAASDGISVPASAVRHLADTLDPR